MKAMLSVVVAISFQATATAATNYEVNCPPSVIPAELVKSSPAGWQAQLPLDLSDPHRQRSRPELQLLAQEPSMGRPPAVLMPDNAGTAERDHHYVWHFNGDASIWVSCAYADRIRLFQTVPGRVHMCQTKPHSTVACSVSPD